MSHTPRPVFLKLTALRFPLPAILSILHRISGVGLFLLWPLALWGLHVSLQGAEGFAAVQSFLHSTAGRWMAFCFLAPLLYHFLAGCRHLVMDLGVGLSLSAARCSARLVSGVAILLIVVLGVSLWRM